jgi:nitroreductase
MEFEQAVRRRRMVRSYTREPVAPAVVDEICDLARRAPTAGNTAGVDFLVLEGDAAAAYWDVTLPAERRDGFAWPGLLAAPVLVVVWVDPDAYVSRYREPDKDRTGLGAGASAWPVPYWFVDGGAAVMTILLAAQDRGLGACFFGMFDHEGAVRRRFGVPPDRRGVGTVALGHPAADDRPSSSARRGRPPLDDVLHRGWW